MTFDEYYSANIASGLPKDFPPQAAAIAKKQMANCWNAALEAARERLEGEFNTEFYGDCLKTIRSA